MAFIAGLSPAATYAIPMDPLDPPPIEEVPEDTFTPPAAGFTWSTPSRFGRDADGDGIIDYHWDAATATYNQAYVNPNGFQIDFDGCQTEDEANAAPTVNTYRWEVFGTDVSAEANACRWSHVFPAEGEYEVKLTITTPDGAAGTYRQVVEVDDLFIVSIGDSYGSGEGNPDVPQTFDDFGFVKTGARWVDKRCHRSAFAGSAQAAMTIERADYQTSVTFISLACSGATINAPIYSGEHYEGSGILAPYRGADPANPNDYNEANFLRSQLQVLSEVANGREIDALIVSGGGNDVHFADIIADCVWHNMPRVFGLGGRCHEQPAVLQRLADDLAALPGRYDALAEALHDSDPEGRPALNIKNVYLTEYPDPTRDDNGETCGSMLGEIIPTTPFDFAKVHIDRDEAEWARNEVVHKLNAQIEAATERHADKGWHFVTGISEQYTNHGYCANDHWVVQPYESARQQGPVWGTTTSWGPIFLLELKAQKGTMHPNGAGHRAYARQIVQALLAAEGPGPSFSTATSSGSITSTMGANGWLTGSCDGGVCSSNKAVFTVAAEDGAGIRAASMTVNGLPCAQVPGITCVAGLDDANTYRWTFEISVDGIYKLNLVASNQNGPSSSFLHDVKVDLHDPGTPAASVAAGTSGANGWYLSPVDVVMNGTDTPGGSGVALIQYQSSLLAGNALFTAVPGATVAIGQDITLQDGTIQPAPEGEYVIQYRAVDQAGRMSPTQSLTVKIDQTQPDVTCDSADGLWHAADVSVACTSSDSVSGLAESADATFNLTTSVPAGIETVSAETNSHTVCDLAGNCVEAGPVGGNMVDRKAPEIRLVTPGAETYTLNQEVAAHYECVDGGSGVVSCQGTVENGSALDTSSTGTKSFSIDAVDNVENTSSAALTYDVTYAIHALYDQTKVHKSGSTVPVKLQIHDANGANMSSADIVLTSVKMSKLDGTETVTNVASSANPDSVFRYDKGLKGYMYNLKLKGLSAGAWLLTFTVSGDPVEHTVAINVR